MDNKVFIYGLVPDGLGGFTPQAFTFDSFNLLGTDLNLSGVPVVSWSPFDQYNSNSPGLTVAFLPTINVQYLFGKYDAVLDQIQFGRAKYCSNESTIDPTAAQMVAELSGEVAHDAPAANTAAQINISTTVGEVVRVTGFGFTVTAVAAIVAPILVSLVADPLGTPVVRWSTRVLLPVGQSKEFWIEGPFALFDTDLQLTCAAPGATNFATVSIAYTTTGSNPS